VLQHCAELKADPCRVIVGDARTYEVCNRHNFMGWTICTVPVQIVILEILRWAG
jgi:hypothetical protein